MSNLDSRKPQSKRPALIALLVILAAAILAGGYKLAPRFERQAPVITLTPDAEVVGRAPIEIAITDQGRGLEAITATLSADGKDFPITKELYVHPIGDKTISVALADLDGLEEGEAVLRVSARDGSLWRYFGGNETVLEKKLTIDLTAPTLELMAEDRYVNYGGVGAIVYEVSDDTVTSGVKVGGHFFPGHKGVVKDAPERYLALFAHPYDASEKAKAMLVATDKAGNTRQMGLAYVLKNVKHRKSTIAVSERFIQRKVAPLLGGADAGEGGAKETFLAVNKGMRKENEDRIAAITSNSTSTMQWKGAFVQLSNSQVEANFADRRTYTFEGEAIDQAYHLGYDLSVTKRYPVEAANSGTVVFAGNLGIYGNTVILDHGIGLFTLYSHLSSIDVKDGDKVEQRQILGKTGETGLAGGDHLHYGVYLHGVAVLPVEWWDPKWIRDNIEPKLRG